MTTKFKVYVENAEAQLCSSENEEGVYPTAILALKPRRRQPENARQEG